MKVLWLTNHILPEHAAFMGRNTSPIGGWMPALADALAETSQIELGIATNIPDCVWSKKEINNKIYFSIPVPRRGINYRTLPASLIEDYQRAVNEFRPDIIHVHGTEYFHGLLTGRRHIDYPSVISIQGIIDVYKEYYWGGISFSDLVKSRTLRDWLRADGLIEQKIRWHQRAKWEREIFTSNNAFIGRTQWDRAYTRQINPAARYYHCDELLRKPFYEAHWNLDHVQRYRIYAPSASYPIKGFHTLIKAVSLLKREFPDIIVRTPLAGFYIKDKGIKRLWKNLRSVGYNKYLNDLIEKEGVGAHVSSLGVITAEEVAQELTKAHVFVLPSFIENSPNSLAEAMMVGTPSVVSFVGGVPSMVQDGVTALCFPPGNAAKLAEQIRKLFLDDDLAIRLSIAAHNIAEQRHAKDKITEQILLIYSSVISKLKIS